MDPTSQKVINALQNHFPIEPHPFKSVAAQLNLTESIVISTLDTLLKEGFLTRFGPLFNAERMGGGLTLAGMALPEADFDRVAHVVNSLPEVAHNYARDHTLNMWFVVATETKGEIDQVLTHINETTGYPVFNMPKLKEYRLGFKLFMGPDGIDTVPLENSVDPLLLDSEFKMEGEPDVQDRAIVAATQDGLSLVTDPYQVVAQTIGSDADTVMNRMKSMLKRGWIRRVGVVPNHYRLGLKGNGMSVWHVPDDVLHESGLLVGSLGFVSHCYHRPQHLPDWPFNLFAMVHGRDNRAVAEKVEKIHALLQPNVLAYNTLHSTRILKKSGLRIKTSTVS